MEKHFELVIMIPTNSEEKRMPRKKYFDFPRGHDDVMLWLCQMMAQRITPEYFCKT